ncbi:MAG: zinc-dependent metalloprotease [Solirubrobacteraceae bacterium]
MIDWALVSKVAGVVAGESRGAPFAGHHIPDIARDAEQRVVAYTGLTPATMLPRPELISRPGWIAANVDSMRPFFDALEQRIEDAGPTPGGNGLLGRAGRAASGAVLSTHLGGLTGFLAQRVLGQYEMPLLDPDGRARLLLVGPNLARTAEKLGASDADLLRWVTLHEVTHGVQFTAVPWLRSHLAAALNELLDSLEMRVSASAALRIPSADELREVVQNARSGGLITFVIGQERRALLDRLQTTMAVIEGHAEHVMDAVGADVIPSQAALRAALELRRATRSTPLRLIERVLGLELKLRQYREGKRFCDWVVRRGGPPALNRVWASPEALPTPAELADPDVWIARTDAAALTS